MLASSGGYDVIVDGLNVAICRFPGIQLKSLDHQSISVSLEIKHHLFYAKLNQMCTTLSTFLK